MKYNDGIVGMSMRNKFDLRLRMVNLARREGISQAARVYETTRNTVRKWVGRYLAEGLEGLKDRSRVPKVITHKIPVEEEEQIVALRKRLPRWGQDRLKEEFGLGCSSRTVNRVLRQHGLIKKRKKRWQKHRDLRAQKRRMSPFEKLQIDVKELRDIEAYFPQMIRGKLPSFQYTARDMKTGALFTAYAYANSSSNAALFAAYVSNHLAKYGIDLGAVCYQTDNGSEFIGSATKRSGQTAFEGVVKGAFGIRHLRIPPRSPTWNSDVEASHRMIQDDFYEVEDFKALDQFRAKAYTYLLYFNYKKKNRWRDRMSPLDILVSSTVKIDPGILSLPPPILEHFYHHPQW